MNKKGALVGEPYEYLVAGQLWGELDDDDIVVKEPSQMEHPHAVQKDGYID